MLRFRRCRRRLESVENQTEQLGQAAAGAKDIGQLKEDSLKDRLTSIEKSLRDVGRNVQLVRDRQVCCADSLALNLHIDALTALTMHPALSCVLFHYRSWREHKQNWQHRSLLRSASRLDAVTCPISNIIAGAQRHDSITLALSLSAALLFDKAILQSNSLDDSVSTLPFCLKKIGVVTCRASKRQRQTRPHPVRRYSSPTCSACIKCVVKSECAPASYCCCTQVHPAQDVMCLLVLTAFPVSCAQCSAHSSH